MQSEGGAYGAGRAGAPFDPAAYIKKPEVITRIICLLFAIVVFGCVAAKGYELAHTPHVCLYNEDPNACGYGIGIGVIAFIICIAFLVLDAIFDQISGVQIRKYVVMADIAVSGLWCFLWFIGFIYMTNQWAKTLNSDMSYEIAVAVAIARNDLQAALAFTFFSVPAWGVLTALAVRRYREGVNEEFASGDAYNNPDIAQSSNPYSSFGGEVGQSAYQQPPFAGTTDPPPQSTTENPAY